MSRETQESSEQLHAEAFYFSIILFLVFMRNNTLIFQGTTRVSIRLRRRPRLRALTSACTKRFGEGRHFYIQARASSGAPWNRCIATLLKEYCKERGLSLEEPSTQGRLEC